MTFTLAHTGPGPLGAAVTTDLLWINRKHPLPLQACRVFLCSEAMEGG